MTNVFQEVVSVIATLFGIQASDISRSTEAIDVDGWDSIRHTELIVLLEEQFDIEFSIKDVQAVNNVGELSDLVQATLDQKSSG